MPGGDRYQATRHPFLEVRPEVVEAGHVEHLRGERSDQARLYSAMSGSTTFNCTGFPGFSPIRSASESPTIATSASKPYDPITFRPKKFPDIAPTSRLPTLASLSHLIGAERGQLEEAVRTQVQAVRGARPPVAE